MYQENSYANVVLGQSRVRAPSKITAVSLRKKPYSYCLVLVGPRNGFERDFTIAQTKLRASWKID